jgi:hypothetical protein
MKDLLKRLKRGWTSSADWWHEHHSLKLTSRVSDARAAGHKIVSREVKKNGKRFYEYRLG